MTRSVLVLNRKKEVGKFTLLDSPSFGDFH